MIGLSIDTTTMVKGGTSEEAHPTARRCRGSGRVAGSRRPTKHKKSKEPTEAEKIAEQNDNTKRLLVDLVSLVLPS